MDKIRKFYWIPYKKHRSVVAHHVPIALFSVEFNGEASQIPDSFSRSFLPSECRKSNENRDFVVNLLKALGLSISGYVMRD